MRYGSVEYQFAAPFAEALTRDVAFRTWVLKRTMFATYADDARLLDKEMHALRSPSAESYWRSHYTEKCRCPGCRGQETDLLAVFESGRNYRFALHVEIKQPKDKFPNEKDQAANYSLRAACWVRSPPKAVLPHSSADTMLLFSEAKRQDYGSHLPKFGSVLSFEEVAAVSPFATSPAVTGRPVA
jgi:hypothetical protein